MFGTPLALAAPVATTPTTEKNNTTTAPAKTTPKKETVKPVTPKKTEPKPVAPVTPPVEKIPTEVTVAPTTVKVLGDETTATADPAQNLDKRSAVRTFFEQALSSPRKSVTYAYEAIALLVAIALTIFLVKTEIHHPPVIARGVALIAVIALLSFVNLRVLDMKTEVPTDNHNLTANVIEALP